PTRCQTLPPPTGSPPTRSPPSKPPPTGRSHSTRPTRWSPAPPRRASPSRFGGTQCGPGSHFRPHRLRVPVPLDLHRFVVLGDVRDVHLSGFLQLGGVALSGGFQCRFPRPPVHEPVGRREPLSACRLALRHVRLASPSSPDERPVGGAQALTCLRPRPLLRRSSG